MKNPSQEKRKKTQAGLFAQKHSSRDYTREANWGKNIFNSSFPASLGAYMFHKGIKPVYLRIDENNNLVHDYIGVDELYGIDPLSDRAYYNYETGFSQYELYYTGEREKIDLVMHDRLEKRQTSALEVKLTALPDNTTRKGSEDEYSCEIVVRPPTICFLACSLCDLFVSVNDKEWLRQTLNQVPHFKHWEDAEHASQHFPEIENAVKTVAKSVWSKQKPLIMQPVWKTVHGRLADDCLDIFVWSNLAILHMCYNPDRDKSNISRFDRTIVWIYQMLRGFVDSDTFNYKAVKDEYSYNLANDKAFAIPGKSTYPLLKCKELTHPRINKNEIKNIILGGGQRLLSPERRFDAAIVNCPDLFD